MCVLVHSLVQFRKEALTGMTPRGREIELQRISGVTSYTDKGHREYYCMQNALIFACHKRFAYRIKRVPPNEMIS